MKDSWMDRLRGPILAGGLGCLLVMASLLSACSQSKSSEGLTPPDEEELSSLIESDPTLGAPPPGSAALEFQRAESNAYNWDPAGDDFALPEPASSQPMKEKGPRQTIRMVDESSDDLSSETEINPLPRTGTSPGTADLPPRADTDRPSAVTEIEPLPMQFANPAAVATVPPDPRPAIVGGTLAPPSITGPGIVGPAIQAAPAAVAKPTVPPPDRPRTDEFAVLNRRENAVLPTRQPLSLPTPTRIPLPVLTNPETINPAQAIGLSTLSGRSLNNSPPLPEPTPTRQPFSMARTEQPSNSTQPVDSKVLDLRNESLNKIQTTTSGSMEQAISLYKARRFSEAIPQFQQYLATHNDESARWYLGQCHRHLGQWAQAREEFSKLRTAANREWRSEGLYQEGLAASNLGEETRARQLWQQVIDSYPQTKAAVNAQRCLEGTVQ